MSIVFWDANFLSKSLCRSLCDELEYGFWRRSYVTLDDGTKGRIWEGRTSETFHQKYFPTQLVDRVSHIERKVQGLLGLESEMLEGWQALRYSEGAEFKIHHDDRNGVLNRVLSMVFILQAPGQGGVLRFPHIDVEIEPAPGTAIFWFNHSKVGVPNLVAEHQVTRVAKGTRVSLVNWAISRPSLSNLAGVTECQSMKTDINESSMQL